MAGFNYTFGGQLVEPAQLSYLAFNFPFPATATPNQLQMNWPVSFIDSLYIMAEILDITTSGAGQSLVLPPANQVSNGQQVLINNYGASPLTIYTNDAGLVNPALLVIAPGQSWFIYLTNNATSVVYPVNGTTYYIGTWRTIPFAAGYAGVVTSVGAVSTTPDLIITGSPITNAGVFTFSLGADLLALTSFGAGTGYVVHTGVGTYALRTIVPVNANITITNGNGVAGNTAVGLNNILVGLTSVQVGNMTLSGNTITSTTAINLTPAAGNSVVVTTSGAGGLVSTNISVPLGGMINFYDPTNASSVSFSNFAGVPPTITHYYLPVAYPTGANQFLTASLAQPSQLSWAVVPPPAVTGTLVGNNRLVNGDMQIWQRGAGGAAVMAVAAASNAYTADRWQLLTGANQACTVTQTAGATTGSWLARVQRNAAQAGVTNLQFAQSLTLGMSIGAANNIATISFKAYAGANYSAAGSILTCSIIYGTGNASTSVLTTGFVGQAVGIAGNAVLTNVLTNFTFSTLALPNTVTQLAVIFSYIPVGAAGVDDSFYLTDCQLEISPNQTPFQRLSFETQKLNCYPFYQKTFTYATAPAQNVGTGTGEQIFMATIAGANAQRSPFFNFIIPLRVAPTGGNNVITQFSPGAATAQIYDETAPGACTNTTAVNITQRGFYDTLTGNAGTTVGGVLGIHYTIEGEVF